MDALIGAGAIRLVVAHSPWQRAIGLIGRRSLDQEEGLLIPRCAAVHTFGMRMAIDIVFVDCHGEVLRIDDCVPPRRFRACRGADAVVELAAGAAARLSPLIEKSVTISLDGDGCAWLRPGRGPVAAPTGFSDPPGRYPVRIFPGK